MRGVSTHDGGVAYVAEHVHKFGGGEIKMDVILLGRGVFVLVISNIKSISQKSLTAPMSLTEMHNCYMNARRTQ